MGCAMLCRAELVSHTGAAAVRSCQKPPTNRWETMGWAPSTLQLIYPGPEQEQWASPWLGSSERAGSLPVLLSPASTLLPSPATAWTEPGRDAEPGWGAGLVGLWLSHHSVQSLLLVPQPSGAQGYPARTGLLWVCTDTTMNGPGRDTAQPGEPRKAQELQNRSSQGLNSKTESWKALCSYSLISKFSPRIGGSALS